MMKMRRMPMVLSALAMAAVLVACGSPAQSPAATSEPVLQQATTAPAVAPAQNVTAARPVFIDFYAPW